LASSTLRRTLRLDGAGTAEVSRGPRSGLTARTIQGEHDGDVDRDSAKGRWVGYLLTPASLILLGGSLGDRLGAAPDLRGGRRPVRGRRTTVRGVITHEGFARAHTHDHPVPDDAGASRCGR
jgi:hypothetical protein